jgi:flavin reductase (DIM6/NTAB) family NADH-FMN oxidoreductase RutF
VSSEDVTAWLLEQLWAPLVALTAAHDGRRNGLIASTAVTASLLPEAPRIVVDLAKANLTCDLVLASGAFAVHMLPAAPATALRRSLELVRLLGMRSGRDGDKMAGVETRPGITGSPILVDALAYLEARVASTLEADEVTVVLADVVGGGGASVEGLTIEHVRERMPADWAREWDERRERELAEGRARRRAKARS